MHLTGKGAQLTQQQPLSLTSGMHQALKAVLQVYTLGQNSNGPKKSCKPLFSSHVKMRNVAWSSGVESGTITEMPSLIPMVK